MYRSGELKDAGSAAGSAAGRGAGRALDVAGLPKIGGLSDPIHAAQVLTPQLQEPGEFAGDRRDA